MDKYVFTFLCSLLPASGHTSTFSLRQQNAATRMRRFYPGKPIGSWSHRHSLNYYILSIISSQGPGFGSQTLQRKIAFLCIQWKEKLLLSGAKYEIMVRRQTNSLVELGNVVACPKPMIFFNVSLHIESRKESEQALSPSMKVFSLSSNCDPGMYKQVKQTHHCPHCAYSNGS